ncbi:hypothetical protein [Borreliella lusitaniae]|uniref:hypothetical protein n=1 Tax=Borreliella lusitaniae TaxID=100177 RepID=UPI00292EAF28|nr:hypothetical protein [Borreliella lusitaniae]WNY67256.1 hypothetical protein QIA40_04555 [Borreliella lusitaniae]
MGKKFNNKVTGAISDISSFVGSSDSICNIWIDYLGEEESNLNRQFLFSIMI